MGISPGATPSEVDSAPPGSRVDRKVPLEVKSTLPVAVTTTISVLTEGEAVVDLLIVVEDVEADDEARDEDAVEEVDDEAAPDPGK